jgi:hypothetical protein
MFCEQAIDHRAKRVSSRVMGSIGVDDVREHLEREAEEGALPYPEFVDASTAIPQWSTAEVRDIVDLLSRHARRGPVGPIAVLVGSDYAYGTLRMVESLAEPHCTIRPFRSRGEAEMWLASATHDALAVHDLVGREDDHLVATS